MDAIERLSNIEDGEYGDFHFVVVTLAKTLAVAATNEVESEDKDLCNILINAIALANKDLLSSIQDESTYAQTDIMNDLCQTLAEVAKYPVPKVDKITLCLPSGVN